MTLSGYSRIGLSQDVARRFRQAVPPAPLFPGLGGPQFLLAQQGLLV